MVGATLTGTVRHRYDVAVSRNLGFIGPGEQEILRRSTVAIAGAGGDGRSSQDLLLAGPDEPEVS